MLLVARRRYRLLRLNLFQAVLFPREALEPPECRRAQHLFQEAVLVILVIRGGDSESSGPVPAKFASKAGLVENTGFPTWISKSRPPCGFSAPVQQATSQLVLHATDMHRRESDAKCGPGI